MGKLIDIDNEEGVCINAIQKEKILKLIDKGDLIESFNGGVLNREDVLSPDGEDIILEENIYDYIRLEMNI